MSRANVSSFLEYVAVVIIQQAVLTYHLLTGQATDDRKSIIGIPKMFDTLVQGGEDPLVAVKTVVALLAGEPGT